MWWMLAGLALAAPGDLASSWDATPEHDVDPVVVVVTPGFDTKGFLPLIHGLREDGHDVRVISFSCDGAGSEQLIDALAARIAPLDRPFTVVAHGLGATLALQAAPRLDAERYVLLAPVLDLWPVALTRWLAARELPPAVLLSDRLDWQGRSVHGVLLGEAPPALTCAPVPWLQEVQQWVRAGQVPVDLGAVDAPVHLAVSLLDDVAAVEAVVPASRALPQRRLHRLGLNRLDPHDFEHGAMLTDPVPVRWAVRQAR